MPLAAQLRAIELPVRRFLTEDGTDTGNIQMNADYSSVVGEFFVKPPSDEVYILSCLTVNIRNGPGFRADRYGSLTALTNGVRIVNSQGFDLSTTVLSEITLNLPIKANGDWGAYPTRTTLSNYGQGNDFLSVDFDITPPILVDGANDEIFGIILNDDLTGIPGHTGFISGIKVKR